MEEHRRNGSYVLGGAMLTAGAGWLVGWLVAVRQSTTKPPLHYWIGPSIVAVIVFIGGLVVVVGTMYEVPHRFRMRRETKTASKLAEGERRRRATEREQSVVEAHRWHANMFQTLDWVIVLTLDRPSALYFGDYLGTTASCRVGEQDNTYVTVAPIAYSPPVGFRAAFPHDFEALPGSRPADLRPGEYRVSWQSEVLREPRQGTLVIDHFPRSVRWEPADG